MIVVRRVNRKRKNEISAFWEAQFDPPQGHSEGDFEIRVYDDVPDTPYKRDEPERRGAYSVQSDNWCPMHSYGLRAEEKELFKAIQARIATKKW